MRPRNADKTLICRGWTDSMFSPGETLTAIGHQDR